MLFYNEIIPGQQIKYQELANKIGVSITPVIHALKWLEFKNIVGRSRMRGRKNNLKNRRLVYNSHTRLIPGT